MFSFIIGIIIGALAMRYIMFAIAREQVAKLIKDNITGLVMEDRRAQLTNQDFKEINKIIDIITRGPK